MSLIIGNGMCITYFETNVKCPICEQVFDAAKKIGSHENPMFNTKCPKCNGKITISVPLFGGFTRCWETNCPPTVKRLKTESPNHVNGVPYTSYDLEKEKIDLSKYDEGDEEDGDGDAPCPLIPNNPIIKL